MDEAGCLVPCADDMIRVSVEGGELVGAGNADPASTDVYTSGSCSLYDGRAPALACKKEEQMTIIVVSGEKKTTLTV